MPSSSNRAASAPLGAAPRARAADPSADRLRLDVAERRLREARDPDDALRAVQEVLVTVIGTEQLAVYERALGEPSLRPVAAMGFDGPPAAGAVEMRCAADGHAHFGPGTPGSPVACVPLALDGRTAGVLAIYRLLPHKPVLDAGDHALLAHFAAEAAPAVRGAAAARAALGVADL